MPISTQGNTTRALANLARKRKGLGPSQAVKPGTGPISTQPTQALAQLAQSQMNQASAQPIQAAQNAQNMQSQLSQLAAGQTQTPQDQSIWARLGQTGQAQQAQAGFQAQQAQQAQLGAGLSQAAVNTGKATPVVGGPTAPGALPKKKKLPLGTNTVTG